MALEHTEINKAEENYFVNQAAIACLSRLIDYYSCSDESSERTELLVRRSYEVAEALNRRRLELKR